MHSMYVHIVSVQCMSNVMHHAGFKQVQCKHVQPWQQTTCSTDCDTAWPLLIPDEYFTAVT